VKIRPEALIEKYQEFIGAGRRTANVPMEHGYVTIQIINPKSVMERQQHGLHSIEQKCLRIEGRIRQTHILLIVRTDGSRPEWHAVPEDTFSTSTRKFVGGNSMSMDEFLGHLDAELLGT